MTTDPTAARPAAGQRTDPPPYTSSSEWRPGGLMSIGARVEVTVPFLAGEARVYTGVIVDRGSVPAPLVVLGELEKITTPNDRIVIFLGPGVTIIGAWPVHPAIG